ncbi:hypothetical protein AB0395_27795, partial [Streptosporangium sp. NPDC051023]|uniref:hypothetical protein n=1 Tax=Streptosporangium sp. NPDC051023 TaxID=3155410 RepID=UPI00345065C5
TTTPEHGWPIGVGNRHFEVVERLMSVMARPGKRTGFLGRALKSCALGLAAATVVCFLSGVVMAVLVGGNGYVSDASTRGVYVLAVLFGVAAGLWVGVRWWRRLKWRRLD